MKKLPIGIQTFAKITENDLCYVDKTPLIGKLAEQGEFHFLSRPRRFGKSLLIDTIAEVFQGKKSIFKGLYLEKNWDWNNRHPVIRIDFAEGVYKTPDRLESRMMRILASHAGQENITLSCTHIDDCFEELITALLESIRITDTFMGSFDVDYIEPSPLLFQTGYLTIKQSDTFPGGVYYTLGFPNHEVKYAFNDALLTDLTRAGQEKDQTKLAMLDILTSNNLDELKQIFHAFFASIPHDWYRKNDMAGYEGYYCSIVYSYFTALGLDVRVEASTNHGQLDMAVLFNENVYIFEFKVNEFTQPAKALDQIKQKKYYEKYTTKEIYLIGIEFGKKDRNITRFEWEKVV